MFIAADINKRSLMRSQSQIEFKMIIISNQRTSNTKKIAAREQFRAAQQAECDKWNSENPNSSTKKSLQDIKLDSYYQGLKALDDEYSLKQESLESELEIVKAQKESLGKLVQNNISQDCALWCVGGSS